MILEKRDKKYKLHKKLRTWPSISYTCILEPAKYLPNAFATSKVSRLFAIARVENKRLILSKETVDPFSKTKYILVSREERTKGERYALTRVFVSESPKSKPFKPWLHETITKQLPAHILLQCQTLFPHSADSDVDFAEIDQQAKFRKSTDIFYNAFDVNR